MRVALIATETEIGIIQDIIEGQVNEALNELSAYEPQQNAGSAGITKGSDNGGDVNSKAAMPRLSVSQWADLERRLSSEASAEAGRWHTMPRRIPARNNGRYQ